MIGSVIVDAARQCVGLPFRHQGRYPMGQVDCAGVVIHALNSAGLDVVDQTGYGRTPNKGLLESAIKTHKGIVEVGSYQAGDILLMRFGREPQHLAIFSGGGIIHADEASGVCCEHRLDSKWASRIVRIYRLVGAQ